MWRTSKRLNMIPISAPFTLEDNVLIGMDEKAMNAFFKQVTDWSKLGKIYQLVPREVTASEVQKNYIMLCISMIANDMAVDPKSVQISLEEMIFYLASDPNEELYLSSTWLTEVIDLDTGEVLRQKLISMSSWTSSMFSDFQHFFSEWYKRKNPKFSFPDPDTYKLPRKGRKRELPNPELRLTFKF